MIRNVDETAYLEELKLKLKDEGFKLTHQRRNIVEVLLSANGKCKNAG